MSNDALVTASQVPGSVPRRWSIAVKKLSTLPRSTMTPLGRPVDPEV